MKMKRAVIFLILMVMGIAVYRAFFSTDRYTALNQQVSNCDGCTVKNEETAVDIAEEILFETYGQSRIKDQRPYEVRLLGNKVWSLKGTLNNSTVEKLVSGGMPAFGGTFEIDIDPRDGKILKIIHYK
ncbi:YbbC/YhhH family protein [Kaistella faecalis]|uniref:YbbC/YhhH family protein n=2 Tax=Kaistella faecalis TaxID=2852098 RepID=UPI001E5F91A9|nr:YbbC/YhhH family protein [Chryseobacterium faecale]UFK98254.1 YbbC/YhhH family protein [Chryseobacterium faecale]